MTATQYDNKVRVVALANLEAMCERVSGMCHRYEISKVSRSRVHVTYSNPDEYGNSRPMTAVFPCYPFSSFGNPPDNPFVALDILRVINDDWDGEGWQSFHALLDCPQLWRDPQTDKWQTRYEILVQRYPEATVTSRWDSGGCIQTWYSGANLFRSYDDAIQYAEWYMNEMEVNR